MGLEVAIGGGLLLGGLGSYLGGKSQADAAKEGQQLTAEQVKEAQRRADVAAANADSMVGRAVPRIQGNLEDAYLANADYLGQGFGTARQDILGSGALGADALAQGQGQSLSTLYDGAGQGVNYLNSAQQGVDTAINSGLSASSDLLMNRQDRAGAMLDKQGGLYGGFENDPGYQYRLQESEKAINRSNAAKGGRLGGAALKELQANAQGLAGQSYNDFANRRLQEFGAAQGSDSMGLQARSQLASLYGSGASQLAGAQQQFGSQAANIASGAGQYGAGLIGQTSGQLADVYGRTGSQLAGQASSAGGALGANESDYYKGIGDLDWKQANARAGFGLGAAGAAMQAIPSLASSNMQGAQYAGSGWNALGNIGNTVATVAATKALGEG